MRAGVSTACLYPKLLEESVYDLALNGIAHTEIFVNTGSELERNYINGLASTLKQFEVTCRSLHPFTCAMEPMMFFSGYKRRVDDMLEFYKKYFEAMNILGAEIFIFHGNKKIPDISKELYYESFSRLAETGRGIRHNSRAGKCCAMRQRFSVFYEGYGKKLRRRRKICTGYKAVCKSRRK